MPNRCHGRAQLLAQSVNFNETATSVHDFAGLTARWRLEEVPQRGALNYFAAEASRILVHTRRALLVARTVLSHAVVT